MIIVRGYIKLWLYFCGCTNGCIYFCIFQPASEETSSAIPYKIQIPEDLTEDVCSLEEQEVASDKSTSIHGNSKHTQEQKENDKHLTEPAGWETNRRGRFLISPGRISSRKLKNPNHYSGNPYHDRHASAQPQKLDGGFVKLKRTGRVGTAMLSSRRKSALLTEERIKEKEKIYSSLLTPRLFSSFHGV